jgi:hypothetical protein
MELSDKTWLGQKALKQLARLGAAYTHQNPPIIKRRERELALTLEAVLAGLRNDRTRSSCQMRDN